LYYKIFNNLTPWSPSEYLNVSIPPYIMTLIFESQYVEVIHLRTISLIDVSLPGIIYRVFLSYQDLLPRLNIILDLLIYLHL